MRRKAAVKPTRRNLVATMSGQMKEEVKGSAFGRRIAQDHIVDSSRPHKHGAIDTLKFSLVIPAYNEAQRLPQRLAGVKAYLETKSVTSEVIVVDDGSTDDTVAIVREWMDHWSELRLVQREHRGKGAAVRTGMFAARGEYVALADADFSMSVEQFDRFTVEALGPFDIAIGSREAPGARRIDEPMHRHVMGRVFSKIVELVLLPGIQDTQCGFKCLRRQVALDLCQYQIIEGWGFDPELLYIGRQRGYDIREVPISWRYMPGSRVHPMRDSITMLKDVLMIRYRGWRMRYSQEVSPEVDVAVTSAMYKR